MFIGVVIATALLAHQFADLGLANETDASAKHHARGLNPHQAQDDPNEAHRILLEL